MISNHLESKKLYNLNKISLKCFFGTPYNKKTLTFVKDPSEEIEDKLSDIKEENTQILMDKDDQATKVADDMVNPVQEIKDIGSSTQELEMPGNTSQETKLVNDGDQVL